jgi:hypothetical protein
MADFDRRKVVIAHLCTFDCHFRMAELVPHGGTGEDSDRRVLLLAAEAMLGVVFEGVSRVIYPFT